MKSALISYMNAGVIKQILLSILLVCSGRTAFAIDPPCYKYLSSDNYWAHAFDAKGEVSEQKIFGAASALSKFEFLSRNTREFAKTLGYHLSFDLNSGAI